MNDLLTDPKMSPKRFAGYYADFDFQLFPDVQNPDVFLRTQRGNCQDYAILADYVLKRKDYETILVRVVLVGTIAHDVCYVAQVKSYLDYNNRVYFKTLQGCPGNLRAIANKVADSFDANWTTASAYTYTYDEDIKHMKLTVVKSDPPSEDPQGGIPLPSDLR